MQNNESRNPYLARSVTEDIDFELLFFFRLPTADARQSLPPDLSPLEIAPATSVLAIGIQKILATSFTQCRDIQKLYLGIGVQPRYDLKTATPRFAFFLPRMYSDQTEFTRQLTEVNRVPGHPGAGLRVTYGYDDCSVSARDDDGPIFDLKLSAPRPVFRKVEVWGQCHTLLEGARYIQATCWNGEAFESTGSPAVGALHPHPFFGDLEVGALGDRCYHQMAMKPATRGVMRLYDPVRQRGGHDGD